MSAAADALMGIFGFKRVEGEMSKSVEEVRRAAFEAALRRDWAEHLVALDREGDGYVFGDIDAAWWSWCAALDAVVIQLPSANNYTGCNLAIEDCRAAIEQTGLGLRVL